MDVPNLVPTLLGAIEWNADPSLFTVPEFLGIGPITVRWYGLLFGLGFVAAFFLGRRIWRREGRNVEHVEELLVLVVILTILGARLVHCFVYEPENYAGDLAEVLKVWKGGLASHGGVLGIVLALGWHSLKHADQPFWWLLDRVAAVACVPAAMVRIGNFVNSEIVGTPSDAPWAVVFKRLNTEAALHPAQLYEALLYGVTALVLWRVWSKRAEDTPRGLITGLLLVLVFGGRFLIEFVKQRQGAGDDGALSLGQWLSIPAVLIGLWLLSTARNRGPVPRPA